jgi:hypothetical protein
MKFGPTFLNRVSFMKRVLLSSLLLLAMGRTVFGYENDGIVQVPTMNPDLIQLDTLDGIFINNGFFGVDLTLDQTANASVLYETSDTLNFTNNGTMASIPGFDFENFPSSVGKPQLMSSFVNNGDGFGGGVIGATNIFGGINIFKNLIAAPEPITEFAIGMAAVKIHATNVVDSGLITMDDTGLIDIIGQNLNLNRGQFAMTNNSGPNQNLLDYGSGGFGTNTQNWLPATDLGQNFAISPIFTNFQGFIEQMLTFPATVYFENLNPTTNANNTIIWRVIFLNDTSPANVTASVFFGGGGGFGVGPGAFHIQWVGVYRDPLTGGNTTNYFVLNNDPAIRRGPFAYPMFPGIPSDFSFGSGSTPQIVGVPTAPGFNPAPFAPASVTNDFSFVSIQPTPLSVDTNLIVGGSVTNLPGRIQLTSSDTLDLNNATITGENYMSLKAPVNFLGNSNSFIGARYSDIDLGSTSGSLTISNLLLPKIPVWNSAGTGSGIAAFSGSYIFVDANGVTNDVRVLMVNSDLVPTTEGLQQNVKFHAANNLALSDELNIFNSFYSDTTTLTIWTNANSAFSLQGALNFISQNIFWSASLPNLQYLTNWGEISTINLANYAGNMFTPQSPRSGATPYQAFVNHGSVTNGGVFVRANYFENTGLIRERQNGGIDISASTATVTNGMMIATNGPVSLAGNDLLVSNSVIIAGRSLTFTPACSFSDGYVFGNQFGHATNATLPNVVTNGNFWSAAGGVRIPAKPDTADLLGTTITNISINSQDSFNQWAGEDRGPNPSGFADNLALGRMVFVTDKNPSQFTFAPVSGNNALYVDTIQFRGGATNTDNNGNYTAIHIPTGMKIYYAQALANGVSVAEKLNGKNGGGFMWVSNYAGVYSSTNLNGTLYNQALVISPDIDSDNDGTVNRDDPTPIPPGLTFDIFPIGPQPCAGGTQPPGTNEPPVTVGGGQNTLDTLAFPAHHVASASNSVAFALAQGAYTGLFYETNGVNPASSGFFSAKVTSQGSFSAKLQIGAKSYSLSSKFNQSGNCTGFATGKGLPMLTVSLHLVNNDEIVGQVSAGTSWTAQLLAVTKAPATASKNSLVLSVNSANSTTPSGDSFGTMILKKTGDIQWTGVLPDGVKVSQKSVLSKGGIWPLYSSLYGGSGSLIGWLQVTNGNSDIGGSAVWIVPANQSALFKNGLTNELKAAGSSLANPSAASSSTIILSAPQFASPLTNNVIISGKSGQSQDNSLTLSLDVKNGLFSGSVVDPNSSQTLSFQGALLEKSGTGGGFFLNANRDQGGKVYLAPAN